ncbi:hypothetical protein [Streptomyces virginiae]|uniref:hypothetical protein n=1 Tax=Streptomyces virginiae TaxID=1961 RepID=UPI0030DEF232
MYAVGQELTDRLTATIRDLDLDNRELSLDRAHDDEEGLARLLLASAWYQVNYRTGIGFALTPLGRSAPCAPVAEPMSAPPDRPSLTPASPRTPT